MLTEKEREEVRRVLQDLDAYLNTGNPRYVHQAAYNLELIVRESLARTLLE